MNHDFFWKNTACNEVVTWVVAQEYLKVTPRDLTVNMMKIDFLNESHGSPWELLVKNQTSSKPMVQPTKDSISKVENIATTFLKVRFSSF